MRSSSCRSSLSSLWTLSFAASLLALGACDNGVPTFPPLDIDAGIECSDDRPCEDPDDVCLEGRCYRPCSMTCGPNEVCSGGVCMRGMPPDGGPADAGPPDGGPPPPDAFVPDPCESVTCEGATPFCRGGICIECESSSDCGGGVPICDVGRGRCVAYMPAVCAPCSTNRDCEDTGGTSFGDCVGRGGATEPDERVCMPPCADTSECPSGYRCDTAVMGGHCVPGGGASCTQQLAGLSMRACASDGDCAPVGANADTGLITGSCASDVCRIPCGTSADCPPSMPTCSDTTFFCGP